MERYSFPITAYNSSNGKKKLPPPGWSHRLCGSGLAWSVASEKIEATYLLAKHVIYIYYIYIVASKAMLTYGYHSCYVGSSFLGFLFLFWGCPVFITARFAGGIFCQPFNVGRFRDASPGIGVCLEKWQTTKLFGTAYPRMKFHNFENSPFLMGKSTINGNFHSIAMFVYQRVTLKTFENSQECFTANHSMHVSFFGGWHCREKCLDMFVYFF